MKALSLYWFLSINMKNTMYPVLQIILVSVWNNILFNKYILNQAVVFFLSTTMFNSSKFLLLHCGSIFMLKCKLISEAIQVSFFTRLKIQLVHC